MAKIAQKYLKVDPFKIIEEDFHFEKSKVSESLFSLGNEYHGIRGFFDEGGNVDSLKGSYFNGIYEYSLEETPNAYKGIVKRTHFMINSVNWIKCRIVCEGEELDLGKINFTSFYRELNFKTGVLTRSFIWKHKSVNIEITFERFLSMVTPKKCFQRITFKADKDIKLNVEFSLDSNVLHWSNHCYYNHEAEIKIDDSTYLLNVKTPKTKQKVASIMKLDGNIKHIECMSKDKEIGLKGVLNLKANQEEVITRYVVNNIDKKGDISFEQLNKNAKEELEESYKNGYLKELEVNKNYWENYFAKHDIQIVGDEDNQQGIRFCLFQLEQTYHGLDASNNIGAKGLTGEAYSGHTFWDSETYCLTYYLLNNLKAAKNLLLYRYSTLDKAKERAKMLDCQGACFPIATLNGEEACNLWQHASLQFQPSTGVGYAIYHYMNLTHDQEFMQDYGYELLIEISKFLLSRGSYNNDKSGFGFYCVMGPDEFQMMVNNNTYTNYMAKKTFAYLLEIHDTMSNDIALKIEQKCLVNETFFEKIKMAHDKMIILYDEKTKLFEQHEGFYSLPHIEINDIPVTDFPLYSHWSYDRIYRNDMIKQPDVLMFMYLYNQEFTYEQKLANYNYYEPRCIHESSLSPSVHSILACELNKMEEAVKFFSFATRLDLDDYNRNTCEGLHTTSISGAFLNIVYGFGGVRTDGKLLKIAPRIPYAWKEYSFNITYHNSLIHIKVSRNEIILSKYDTQKIKLKVYDQEIELIDQYKGKIYDKEII